MIIDYLQNKIAQRKAEQDRKQAQDEKIMEQFVEEAKSRAQKGQQHDK